MIELCNITVSFDGQPVLQDFSARISSDENTAIFGVSGSGKTTLLRILAGLMKPDAGKVLGTNDICMSVVFQEDRLLPWLTVQENVALVSDMDTAIMLLRKLGLAEAARERPAQLSGGMRRRVAIARALAFQGDMLLLDEPFNGLDADTKATVAQAILAAGKPVVIVTHNADEAKLLRAEASIRLPS